MNTKYLTLNRVNLANNAAIHFEFLKSSKMILVFKLKFFSIMNIHFIISITQIEFADSSKNSYHRKTVFFSALINEKLNSEWKYKIERLIAKKINIKTNTKFKNLNT